MHDNGAEIFIFHVSPTSLNKEASRMVRLTGLVEKQLTTCQHFLVFKITRKHWSLMTRELRRLNK